MEVEGITDKRLFDVAISFALKNQYIISEQVPFIELALGIHKYSSVVQAYYQFYHTAVLPSLDAPLQEQCPTWLHYSGKVSCNSDAVFALETKKSGNNELILPTDRVLGSNENAPLAVLYADLTDPSFALFHQHLYSSAVAGKIRYIVRYKPSEADASTNQQLTGYGAELYVKRTDYLVIDDRDVQGSNKNSEEDLLKEETDDETEEKEENTSLKSDSEGATISKGNLGKLGFKAAGFILKNENKFEALVNVSLDFPKYSHSISELPADRRVFQELNQAGVAAGVNALYINGARVDNLHDDIFSIVKIIDREREFMSRFKNQLNIEPSVALELILTEEDKDTPSEDTVRYDYRSPSVVWLNNLAKDSRYNRWTKEVKDFLRAPSGQILSPVRHNAHTLVYVFDFSKPMEYRKLAELINLISRTSPIQIGVVPLITSKESEEYAREVLYLTETQGGSAVISYFSALMEDSTHHAAFAALAGKPSHDELHSDEINNLISEAKILHERLDLQKVEPTLFTNGVITPLTQRWFYEITDIIRHDNPLIKELVKTKKIGGKVELKDLIVENALQSRNSIINPTDKTSVEQVDLGEFYNKLKYYSFFSAASDSIEETDQLTTFWILGERADTQFIKQIDQALLFLDQTELKVKLNIVPSLSASSTSSSQSELASQINTLLSGLDGNLADAVKCFGTLAESSDSFSSELSTLISSINIKATDASNLKSNHEVLKKILSGGLTLLSAGRVLVLPEHRIFTVSDWQMLQEVDLRERIQPILDIAEENDVPFADLEGLDSFTFQDKLVALTLFVKVNYEKKNPFFTSQKTGRLDISNLDFDHSSFDLTDNEDTASIHINAILDPLSEKGQVYTSILQTLSKIPQIHANVILSPKAGLEDIPLKRFYRANIPHAPRFDESGSRASDVLTFSEMPQSTLLNMDLNVPSSWVALPESSVHDLENIVLDKISENVLEAGYVLKHLLLEGHAVDKTLGNAPRGMALELGVMNNPVVTDTSVMANLGYLQLKANPGLWVLNVKEGRSSDIFNLNSTGISESKAMSNPSYIFITDITGLTIYPTLQRKPGMETQDVLESADNAITGLLKNTWKKWGLGSKEVEQKKPTDINIFTVASGHLYERFVSIMTISVMKHTEHTVKFWLIENFLSPSFKKFLPHLAEKYGFEYELVTYKWPSWLRPQTEKQRTIWGYKILFLDVLFPQSLDKVIFVDADQIVRTDMMDLNEIDLHGAPYGFTPMCDSREEIEGFRFWKQGYWKSYLGSLKYHISALYVVDLKQFRKLAAGDQLREHYQMLSADPGSLSNLDQDLPNHLQKKLPIFSLPQEWLWCETWCSDESLATARTIDLCNNPMTKEPKLDRARRQVPEWTEYDNLVADLASDVEKSSVLNDTDEITSEVDTEQPLEEEDNDDVYDEL